MLSGFFWSKICQSIPGGCVYYGRLGRLIYGMDDLDLIKQKINIVDLVGEYLPLKKAGINFKALCPFHQEKTPSFFVSPERGIWHCFGCSLGGDHFKFLMLKEGMEFVEALEFLAKRAGVVLKKVGEVQDKKGRLLEANNKAGEFFHYLLTKHHLGRKALDYLKQRGLTNQTIKEFQLGYAPNSWDSLTNFLLKRGFKVAELIQSGLMIASGDKGYDRFRGRVVFPLTNVKGQILGFSGRILDQGEPKYINSPQTPIFDKSNFLFGIEKSKAEVRSKNQAILVEGETDMLLSFQAGVKNVVATKGTALTQGQIELIKRYTDTILLCFDKDLAGDSASRRGIEMADQAGLNLKVIQLKDGKDPAETCLRDVTIWHRAVEEAEPIYDYYLSSVSLRFNPKEAEGKRRIADELVPIWSKITDSLTREHYIQKLAALLSVSEEILRREVRRKGTAAAADYQAVLNEIKDHEISRLSRRELLEEYLLALLLKTPPDLTYVPNFPETLLLSDNLRAIYVLLVLYLDAISFKAASFNINEFIKSVPAELVPIIDRLYLVEIDEKLISSRLWLREVNTVIAELKRALIKASLEKLSAQIRKAQAFGKMELLGGLNKRFRDLSIKLKNL